ncbi:DNA polymerase III subunit delta [Leifsonia xyli subsp. xyli]|uniref:DNA-directed DNA polymerase n=2 Tax=Leifsonia xyli subsp. xyli TaxID=59736 RepID=Q6AEB2_LEIXX|nr:DNA polymerase III subunit delta [Leifsonia xyli]AAT89284.1 DNA polymerase III, delta subunit [Leifsonia xyli subsp. xyli str. CTCB07]ODA90316.1 DNA polymerase III subunit delta [Leifsonia xyli subsp. xyli]
MATRASSRAGASRSRAAAIAIPQLSWSQIRPAPVVLVSGTESFLADRAVRQLREALRAADPSLEISDVSAADYAAGELLTLASPSLFGEPRLIRVEAVERCSDAFLSETLSYLEEPAEGAVVVLRHAGGVRGKKLLDAIRSGTGNGVEVVCAELKKDAEKYEFAQAEFARAGRSISPGALRAVTSAFADDLAELAAACQQLLSDSAEQIVEATVDKYYSGRMETNAFHVADVALAGRYGEALVTMRHALASGADPVPMVAAFASKIRTMAKLAGARGGSGQLAQQFGLAPWQVDRARRDLQGWAEEDLGRCIEVLAETDANVKGGGRDPVFALETMIRVVSSRVRL